MNKFIKNINIYLKERKIKNAYITLVTGWEKSKVSRVLSGEADLKMDDAELLATSLGKDMNFFLGSPDDMVLSSAGGESLAFYAGKLGKNDKEIAHSLLDMFKFYDALTNLEI
ncbi:hypothetical protein SAMN04487770_12210 [Butyrivibrio sp. ob235]|uniref:hypothetical protein n=1 Tax=Butyrivibrio sp. ob235 TaxID=1761780 RepID=UPI0008C0E9B1|nr:hypothetical protein [Butyrivibrio sp. ob235]SEL96296.1 hypothetical protein SAMN04487770_12210 [Butyrivibrio sp. ob235]